MAITQAQALGLLVCSAALLFGVAAGSGKLTIKLKEASFKSSCDDERGPPDIACAIRYAPAGSGWSSWTVTSRIDNDHTPTYNHQTSGISTLNSFNGYISVDMKCDDTDFWSGNDDMGKYTFWSAGYVTAPSTDSRWIYTSGSMCLQKANFDFTLACNSGYLYPYCTPCNTCSSSTQYVSRECSPPYTDRACGQCNSECSNGCSGPNANQCTNCKNVNNGGTCVAQCPEGKFANVRNDCEPCSTCQGDTYVTNKCSARSNTQCAPCGCNSAGSTGTGCNNANGQCVCKAKVEGRVCGSCKAGFGQLSASEPDGCVPVCLAGCKFGTCLVPNTCDCQGGYYGTRCEDPCTVPDGCTAVKYCSNGHPDTSQCSACSDGYYLNNNKCLACEAGSWCYDSIKYGCGKDQWSAAKATQCEPCWANSHSAPGSATCQCEDSFEKVGQECRVCKENFYCVLGVSKPCESSSHSAPGSTKCDCDDGYFGDQFNCRRCSTKCDTCEGPGDAQCRSCYSGRYLNPDNTCEDKCPVTHWADPATKECDNCGDQCIGCDGGSTNEHCKECKVYFDEFKGNGTCVAACDHGKWVDDKKECQFCHAACDGCRGPLATDCTRCAFYTNHNAETDLSECVLQCPRHRYDAPNGFCADCHEDCDGCTGPGNDECHSCRTVLTKVGGERCAPHCHLEEEYRNSTGSAGPDVCLPCHELCKGCTGPEATQCVDCRYAKFGDECVRECPLDQDLYSDGKTCQADECPAGSAVARSMDHLAVNRLYECEPCAAAEKHPGCTSCGPTTWDDFLVQRKEARVCEACGAGFTTLRDPAAKNVTCNDVNECDAGVCGTVPHGKCSNSVGSYECSCLDGYVGTGVEATGGCAVPSSNTGGTTDGGGMPKGKKGGDDDGSNLGLIIGAACGGAAGLLLLVLLLVGLLTRERKQQQDQFEEQQMQQMFSNPACRLNSDGQPQQERVTRHESSEGEPMLMGNSGPYNVLNKGGAAPGGNEDIYDSHDDPAYMNAMNAGRVPVGATYSALSAGSKDLYEGQTEVDLGADGGAMYENQAGAGADGAGAGVSYTQVSTMRKVMRPSLAMAVGAADPTMYSNLAGGEPTSAYESATGDQYAGLSGQAPVAQTYSSLSAGGDGAAAAAGYASLPTPQEADEANAYSSLGGV